MDTKTARNISKSTITPFGLCAALALALNTLPALAAETSPGLRLIETSPGQRSWMTEQEIDDMSQRIHDEGRCGGFMDVTDRQDEVSDIIDDFTGVTIGDFGARRISQGETVGRLIAQLSAPRLLAHVQKLSSYKNRYYQSDTGVAAAQWIRDQFRTIAQGRTDISVELFSHSFKQPSVIARIQGTGQLAKEIVVLGAHEDSINIRGGGNEMAAPGADDDASGVATLLEAFRVIAQSGYRPARTIEFMTYAGEERGLLGSQDIAKKYKADNKSVFAVMQLDMTMFAGSGKQIVFINDNVNRGLTTFTEKLVDTYAKIPWREDKCGYACSDHASWGRNGYASAFPFEATFAGSNHKIHTPGDTIENNLDSVFGLHFSKVAVAFAVELSAAD